MTYFVFCLACSTQTSTQCLDLNSRMKVGSHNSLAIPRSLQHRIRAFDLQASVAVGIPDSSKYSCSPRATDTSLPRQPRNDTLGVTYRPRQTSPHSRLTIRLSTCVSPLGARPHPPGPNAAFNVRLYLISGRYSNPSNHQVYHAPP
jgi:hypothetical protein